MLVNPLAKPADPILPKILVIDDSPIIQRTIYFALRDRGYQVLMFGDISDALSQVRRDKPDLILLDINFPPDGSVMGGERDGFWALNWLQRMDEVRGVPIIIISGDDPALSGARALAAGAVAYVHKPINKDDLAALIAALIAHKPMQLA
jgi:CheY-like chemotaxis protein